MLMIRQRRLPGMTVRLVIDTTIVGLALAVFVEFVLFPPGSHRTASALVSSKYLYSVGDLILLGYCWQGAR